MQLCFSISLIKQNKIVMNNVIYFIQLNKKLKTKNMFAKNNNILVDFVIFLSAGYDGG